MENHKLPHVTNMLNTQVSNLTTMTAKKLIDYLKDPRMIKAIKDATERENRRYKSGDYNISDYTRQSGEI